MRSITGKKAHTSQGIVEQKDVKGSQNGASVTNASITVEANNDKFKIAGAQVVQLKPLDGAPVTHGSNAAGGLGWNAGATLDLAARTRLTSGEAMKAVEAFATQNEAGGAVRLELVGGKKGEKAGFEAARDEIMNRWPGSTVTVSQQGRTLSLEATLPPQARIAAQFEHLAEKYPMMTGSDRGRYQGKSGSETFDLPRRVDPQLDGTKLASHHEPVFTELAGMKSGDIDFPTFLAKIEASIPVDVRKQIAQVIEDAIRLGDPKQTNPPTAAPFPLEDKDKVRHALNYSWLHSRDMTVIQDAIGYPLESTGRHDIREFTSGDKIKALVVDSKTPRAEWFQNYADTIKADEQVNIAFFNPHMLASIWAWDPDKPDVNQEAMDMHRLSDHHDGEDPVEGAINNIFHQREETFGVRKRHGAEWLDIGSKLEQYESALKLVKSEAGVGVARDVAPIMHQLEQELKITPWTLVVDHSETAAAS